MDVESTLDPGLLDALRVFTIEALDYLSRDTGSPLFRSGPFWRWARVTDGHFHASEQPSVRVQLSEIRSDLLKLASVSSFFEALEADVATRGQYGQLVGTAWERTRFDEGSLVDFLVDLVDETQSFEFDESGFRRVASRLVTFLTAGEILERDVVQLIGLIGPPFEIELDAGVVLRPLQDDEVGQLLNYGLIAPSRTLPDTLGPVDRWIRESRQYCVAVTHSSPKVVGESSADRLPSHDRRAHVIAERLVTAVRIKHGGTIALGPSLTIPGSWRPIDWRSGTFGYGEAMPKGEPVTLTVSDWDKLDPLFQALSEDAVAAPLSVPLRRLRQACLRSHTEDRLIDLMIAAEALFLTKNERSELTYKLAFRSATVIGLAGYTPSAVFEFMKKAYGSRSSVVHGDTPKKLVRLGGDSTQDLGDVADDLEVVLRSACEWAVHTLRSGESIDDWDQRLGAIINQAPPDPSSPAM